MTASLRLLALFATLTLGAGCVSGEKEQPNPRGAASSIRAATKETPSADCTSRLVTGDGVGPIRIDASLDSIRRICPMVRDTTAPPNVNFPNERLVSVSLGADTAVVSLRRGRVKEILLVSGKFATADSIGVGTPLRRLLGLPQAKGYGRAGDLLMVTPSKCGLRFGIAGRFDDLPDGAKDSVMLVKVPPTAIVDRILIDGCEHDRSEDFAVPDDSTFDVQTDTVMMARDLDGNGAQDYVVRESRPYHRSVHTTAHRFAIYLDSIPTSRRPTWATAWDIEGGYEEAEEVHALAHGSLVVVVGDLADYTWEMLLVIRDGKITEEMTHGEDYGEGFLDVLEEGGKLVVDASLTHVMLRGKPFTPAIECKNGNWAAVRMAWDERTRRFVPERPRCVKTR